jgi:hypothetical protein
MRVLSRFLFILVLSLAALVTARGGPSSVRAANTEFAPQQSTRGVDPIPPPLSMIVLGGALLVFGGILRRYLRT